MVMHSGVHSWLCIQGYAFWSADQWGGGGAGVGAEADVAHHGHVRLFLLAVMDAL